MATVHELELLRTSGQHSKLYLAFPQPSVVFKAHVNQVDIGTDIVTEVTYNNVDFGAYTDILPGMTLWVGTTEGAYDLGIGRIRKTCTTTLLYLGRTSEIKFANLVHLTVVDEFGLWARHPFIQSGGSHLLFQDHDVAYTDQHTDLDPVPVLGPDFVFFYRGTLGGGNTVIALPDASDSWVLDGSTITGYLWTAPGASATSGLTTATPSLTYNSPGTYRISCRVTASNSNQFTGYRKVVVYDDTDLPISDFALKSCAGTYDIGGWKFSIEMYDNASFDLVHDRAPVILFARDWYGNVEESLGPISGRENIIACGWISGSDLVYNTNGGSVSFEVQGPQYWLDQIPGFIVGVENAITTATAWTNIAELTFDKGIWHFLHWRSTATAVIDVYLTGVDWPCPAIEAPMGSLWTQVKTVAMARLLAGASCDRYGRLFVERDPQLVPIDERSFENVMTVEAYDRSEEIVVERRVSPDVSMINMSGIVFSGASGEPVFALSDGHILKRYGKQEIIDGLIAESQSQLIEFAGLVLVKRNNPYPRMEVVLVSNMKLLDICPAQQLTIVIDPEECPRGVVISNKLFPKSIVPIWDEKSNSFSVRVTGELEVTDVSNSVKGDIPSNPDDPDDEPLPPIDYPELPPFPFVVPEIINPGLAYKTYTWIINSPVVGGVLGTRVYQNGQLIRVDSYIVGGNSVSFNIEVLTTIGSPGTNIRTSEIVSIDTGIGVIPQNQSVSSGKWLWVDISDVDGVVDSMVITLAFRGGYA